MYSPMWIAKHRTPPRHGDIHDRAEEEEHDELEQAASHGDILRHSSDEVTDRDVQNER